MILFCTLDMEVEASILGKEIEKLDSCAASLLMGCSSGTLHCRGGLCLIYWLFLLPSSQTSGTSWIKTWIDLVKHCSIHGCKKTLPPAKSCSKCCPANTRVGVHDYCRRQG